MPLDPNIDAAVRAQPDPAAGLRADLRDLAKRVGKLEGGQTGRRVYTGAGPPPGASQVPDGALYVDTTNLRLYVRANTAWHYAVLT